MEDHLTWTIPAPFWKESIDFTAATVRREFTRPTILRFATDDYMGELNQVIANDPSSLRLFEAAPETWQTPPNAVPLPTPLPAAPTALAPARRSLLLKLQRRLDALTPSRVAAPMPLKLYQPAHLRYYMVSACLVCRVLGLPDHSLATGGKEKAAFVVRRLVNTAASALDPPDPDTAAQYAFDGKAWTPVADAGTLQPGEEELPLSPLFYEASDARRRRLLIGLIPVARREAYYNAPVTGLAPPADSDVRLQDSRATMLQAQVTAPWNALYDIVAKINQDLVDANALKPPAKVPDSTAQGQARDKVTVQLITVSYYALLELAKLIKAHLPRVFHALEGSVQRANLRIPEQVLYDALTGYAYNSQQLGATLLTVLTVEAGLDSIITPYVLGEPNPGWPSWQFPLVSVIEPDPLRQIPAILRTGTTSTATQLYDLIVKALPETPAIPPPPVRMAAQVSAGSQEAIWFAVRCVLSRPGCGPLTTATVSAPTAAFQMANFFDPDAPARPIRIGLPIDPTLAGLRKADKNTAFVMSDMLACHFRKMQGLTLADLVLSVLPWPFRQPLPNTDAGCAEGLGLVCSFSIPIITICALILLIIIVKVLDIIFQWMPFFTVCFPIPKFKSKESG